MEKAETFRASLNKIGFDHEITVMFYIFASIINRLAFDIYLIVNCLVVQLLVKMSCILNIETSTSVCSVALSMDGEVLFAKASFDGPSHAALLGVFVEEALSALKKKEGKKLDAVAVSSGPGSYTGLRIGVSVS